MKKQRETWPVVILCGGMGSRLSEETETKPKPLVEVGGRPLLWHIMKHYAGHGFTDFILCLGYKGHLIRDFFLTYDYNLQDIRIRLGETTTDGRRGAVETLGKNKAQDRWSVTLADTGNAALTGARVKRIEQYVEAPQFMLTYGDGVSNVDLAGLVKFHRDHGRIGTVTGVRPPSRFGELLLDPKGDGNRVARFAEKPDARAQRVSSGLINGGFFAFSKKFFKYLGAEDGCILEKKPLEKLSRDKQLMAFRHEGFWQCVDTMRDLNLLRELWNSGKPPWRTW